LTSDIVCGFFAVFAENGICRYFFHFVVLFLLFGMDSRKVRKYNSYENQSC
jgi:hypothetical protein